MSWAQNTGTKEMVNLQCRNGGSKRSSPTIRRLVSPGQNTACFQCQVGPRRVSILRIDFSNFLWFKIRNLFLAVLTTRNYCPTTESVMVQRHRLKKSAQLNKGHLSSQVKRSKNLPTVPPTQPTAASSLQSDGCAVGPSCPHSPPVWSP